jgi:hypothetical protein
MSATPRVAVIASYVRWPYKVAGLTIYRLITDGGDFVSASHPDIFDNSSVPTVLTAELMPGSVVRVQTNDTGAMSAIQLVHPIYSNPFSGT